MCYIVVTRQVKVVAKQKPRQDGGENQRGNTSDDYDIGVCVELADQMDDDTNPRGYLQRKRLPKANG